MCSACNFIVRNIRKISYYHATSQYSRLLCRLLNFVARGVTIIRVVIKQYMTTNFTTKKLSIFRFFTCGPKCSTWIHMAVTTCPHIKNFIPHLSQHTLLRCHYGIPDYVRSYMTRRNIMKLGRCKK